MNNIVCFQKYHYSLPCLQSGELELVLIILRSKFTFMLISIVKNFIRLVVLSRLAVILFLILSFSGWTQDREFQIRNINNVEVKLGKITSVALYSRDYYTPRTGYNNLAFFGDFAGEYDVNKWLEVGAAARVMGFKRDYCWEMEQRPMIFGNLTAMMGKTEIELTNRFENRIIKDL
jgi:hypothetical protein